MSDAFFSETAVFSEGQESPVGTSRFFDPYMLINYCPIWKDSPWCRS